jgi:dolichol-phosphate mannosyltransferase
MKLVETYAANSGLTISKPFIYEKFFPLNVDRYITIHKEVKYPSRKYLYWQEVVDILNQMPEESRFIRGMRTWIGFKQIGITYDRHERASGDSKYTFSKLFQLALNGIFNFSESPVKLISTVGFFVIIMSIFYFISILLKKLFFGIAVIEGFTSLLFVIILFGGMQLMAIGILGEYILRIFFQSKSRPNFIIDKEICAGKYLN